MASFLVLAFAFSTVSAQVAGITVSPTSGLTTTEAGGTDTFTVVLDTLPTEDVIINVSSSNSGEGTLSAASLTFTVANWDTPQTVTVTGVDDAVVDGPVAYSIITAPATSADPDYNGLDAANVSVTNTDNDTAGITVNPTSGLTTTEAGGAATFTVVLDTLPAADVTIGLSSSDPSEGTVSPGSVTFTPANGTTAQTVTVTGVNDFVVDGDKTYTIVTAAATSTDGAYNGLDAADVSVTNTDNDTPGITVIPTSGLTTREAGDTATFTVALDSLPLANVTIGLSSSDTSEGTVSRSSLTFTSANGMTPQTVTVTGVDDGVVDGNVAYTIRTAAATSADPVYNERNATDISVTNTDNDTAGITVNPTSGLTTTEGGGTATFTVALGTLPTANVTIGLSSDDTSEGTVSPSILTFTSANGTTAQTVTVTGVNDSVVDGNVAYTIVTAAATSTDGAYNGMNPADVSVTNMDNDVAGGTVNPTSGLTTTEGGGTAIFTVVLDTLPAANVTIGLSSDDTSEGTVSPASVTFTSANGTTPQTVTVTGVNDSVVDGDKIYTIVTAPATSSDVNYNNRNAADVSVTNTDNDTAGITVNPTSGLTTTEGGGTATFTVVLNTLPLANVTIGLNSSDTSEGTVNPASLTFTTVNGTTLQTVMVTGVNDSGVDGNVAYTIVTTAAGSADPIYHGRNAADVSVTNSDDDVAIPNVVGLKQAAAETALIDAGLTLGAVTTQPSDTIPAGDVISQNPLADSSGTSGSAVSIVVSSGPPVFLMGVQNDPNTGPLVNSLYRLRTNGVVTKIGDLNHRTHGLAFVGSTLYSVEERTLSSMGTQPNLYRLSPETGATLASIPLSLSTGEALVGGLGLATDPGTGQLWALLTVLSEENHSRRLVTINPATGAATQIAKIPGRFVDMAFDAASILYAITDNFPIPGNSTGLPAPARIYRLNKTTGAATEFLDVSAGAVAGQQNFRESETIGTGVSSDLLYHLSGQNKTTTCCTKNILYETIHLVTKARTSLSLSGPEFFVTSALALVPTSGPRAQSDLDANGKTDLVWRNVSDGTTAIWLMNGANIATSGFPGGVPLVWQIAGTGDVNGDSMADVIWRNNTTGTVAVWLMNGLTVTSVGFPGSASTDFQIAAVGDVNGDGKSDLIWRNTNDGTTAIWLMNGTVMASAGFPGGVPLAWQIAGAGDVNGDGKADVIWRHSSSGTVAVWLMNGLSVTSVGFPGSASTDFQIAGVGDVNGNGKADLIFRHIGNGTTAIWLMNGATIASAGFPAGVPLVWQIVQVGDVSGDGLTDVIWHHSNSGTVAVWLMNGLTITSVGFPGSASLDWEIQ